MIIVPALLTDNRETLEEMVRRCEGFCGHVHIDIMDGDFVPSHSVTPEDLTHIRTPLKIEAHLMTESPESHIETLLKAGISKIIFHLEATKDPSLVIEGMREKGIEIGMAINPPTELMEAEDLLDSIDSLLLLSVNPGFYGSEFIPDVLEKARELRRKRPDYKIAMDGGLKPDNILMAKGAGVDIACVGSAIMKAKDPKDAFIRLENLIKGCGS
jgi:ribulose-phosphate 3-epimerase